MIFADCEPQALWEEDVGDSHGLGVLEYHRDSSLLSLFFLNLEKSYLMGFFYPNL